MNGSIMIKCEPFSEEVELLNRLVANDDHQRQQQEQEQLQDQELRTFCSYKLKLADETIALLESQEIDIECLRKMRLEDVDVLFEGRPLGPKILFREALLEWREEIGLPCRSLRWLSTHKRSAESEDSADSQASQPKRVPSSSGMTVAASLWDECTQQQQSSLLAQEKDTISNRMPTVSYQSFRWPMSPVTLKDILNSSTLGRNILAVGELGVLSKSMQCQLTAIIIAYHMEFETKLSTPQLENYAYCISTLLPHENPLSYHIPRGPNRRNPGGSLYSRFINQKISQKALAIGNSVAAS
ncbi:hypothetical protein AND_007483 [Anopheles darlingi]|uniref:Uncharacterized protein n=1 Tax=Anopheles darlingi TaxID=43151 RepID=W5J8U7_ANODA|nr:uncharacterized protein LOC125956761 [Anopheles darlingi]ETN60882.1 hypothetical protein AND_007483 [Anopheles darlingi]